MSKRKLAQQIARRLERLEKLLDQIDEAHIINSDDPETWDSDVLYDLVESLKEALKLLEDKKHLREKDPWGEPLILEGGLCSLMDEYTSEEEENEDYE